MNWFDDVPIIFWVFMGVGLLISLAFVSSIIYLIIKLTQYLF